jgi:hypothetical protein
MNDVPVTIERMRVAGRAALEASGPIAEQDAIERWRELALHLERDIPVLLGDGPGGLAEDAKHGLAIKLHGLHPRVAAGVGDEMPGPRPDADRAWPPLATS